MLFCSQPFVLFFLAVFALYWLVPGRSYRIYFLLVASIIFYSTWSHWLAFIVVVTSTLDYFIARKLDASANDRIRKRWLAVSVVVNVGVLSFFKYCNFFLESLHNTLLRFGAAEGRFEALNILVPIGISFYTFEAISYTVDVYRRKIPAEKNLAHFLFFILFFPHLLAGPIVRGADFLRQIRRPKRFNWVRMQVGLSLFALGMFKKLAIGDRMALFTDPVFEHPDWYHHTTLWIAAFAYLIQVYCDFSGYSDMAMGTAHLLGYRLAWNFNLPYLAPNVSEFWRRWHITLSSWLRDYVFIPLGGSRRGEWITARNLIIVMTLGGLWHGAGWNFLLFGFIQGVWLATHRKFRLWCETRPTLHGLLQTSIGTVARIAGTMTLFTLTLVVFRCHSMSATLDMLSGMFGRHPGMGTPMAKSIFAILATILVLGYAVARNGNWQRLLGAMPAPVRGFGCAMMMSIAMLLAPDASRAFIYFDF